MRQLGDNGRAEEAAQETFAAVWRSARSYCPERGSARPPRSPRDHRARQRREPVVEVPEASTEAGLDEQAEGAWLAQVHSALEQLPERERVVLELGLLERSADRDRRYLDVPLGTVKTRTSNPASPVWPAR